MNGIRRILLIVAALILGLGAPARAFEAINVPLDVPALDLSGVIEYQHSANDRLQISTSPGTDNVVRRIEVRASHTGPSNWAVLR